MKCTESKARDSEFLDSISGRYGLLGLSLLDPINYFKLSYYCV